MNPQQETELVSFCQEIKPLLEKEALITSANQGVQENFFELFFEDEPNPFLLYIQINEKIPKGVPKFQCLFQYNPLGYSPVQSISNVATANTPQEMKERIINKYKISMQDEIFNMKQIFQKETGKNLNKILTSNN